LSGVPLNETSTADRQRVIDAILHGVGAMPASSDGISDEQIEALADYVAGLRQ
jgi:mono/diheme cytochrome c family protein